jgi:eukaryotic-like serine/threonine-protein kinase
VMIQRWRDFFGRKQEVRRIYARLNATPPGSVSVVGDRKIGKSSLLNYIYMDQNRKTYLEDPRRMIMVFLDFQRERAMTIEAFVSALLSMAQLELRDQLTVSDCSHDLDGVKDLVERIHRGGFRIAILLDEFDTVTTNPNFDLQFFAFLRYLANHYNVAYLTSSARDLQVLCSSKDIADSPFFNIFTMMRLSVFTKEEAVELITVPSERAGKPLGPHADKILEIAGLFPFYLQIACSHAFEYLEEHPGQELDLAEVNRRFYEEAKLHYRFIWNNFDEHEKSAMRRVAMGKSVPDSLKHVVQELERRRLVELQQGKPRLFTPIFENFVRLEYGGGKRMLSRLLGRKS